MSDKVTQLRNRCQEAVDEFTNILEWHAVESTPLRQLELEHIRVLREEIRSTLDLTED